MTLAGLTSGVLIRMVCHIHRGVHSENYQYCTHVYALESLLACYGISFDINYEHYMIYFSFQIHG